MAVITITKAYSFSASHMLPNHRGKCSNLHGHNYEVVIGVKSSELEVSGSSEGMVLDYFDLDEIVEPIIDQLDHHHLNDILHNVPTAENLVVWLAGKLDTRVWRRVSLQSVEVRETPKTSARWEAS